MHQCAKLLPDWSMIENTSVLQNKIIMKIRKVPAICPSLRGAISHPRYTNALLTTTGSYWMMRTLRKQGTSALKLWVMLSFPVGLHCNCSAPQDNSAQVAACWRIRTVEERSSLKGMQLAEIPSLWEVLGWAHCRFSAQQGDSVSICCWEPVTGIWLLWLIGYYT